MHSLDWNDLRYFLAVCRAGTLAEQTEVARSYTDKRATRFYDRNRDRIQKLPLVEPMKT